jgi:hypothetical protein
MGTAPNLRLPFCRLVELQTQSDGFVLHGEVHVDTASLRSGDRERMSGGRIAMKQTLLEPYQAHAWFGKLRALLLSLSSAPFTVHGYNAPGMPVGVLVPRGRDAESVPQRLSFFGEPCSPGASRPKSWSPHSRTCEWRQCSGRRLPILTCARDLGGSAGPWSGLRVWITWEW